MTATKRNAAGRSAAGWVERVASSVKTMLQAVGLRLGLGFCTLVLGAATGAPPAPDE